MKNLLLTIRHISVDHIVFDNVEFGGKWMERK